LIVNIINLEDRLVKEDVQVAPGRNSKQDDTIPEVEEIPEEEEGKYIGDQKNGQISKYVRC
jgi:hypothetical protein